MIDGNEWWGPGHGISPPSQGFLSGSLSSAQWQAEDYKPEGDQLGAGCTKLDLLDRTLRERRLLYMDYKTGSCRW